jgi:SSS family solute:Na+ symporter
MIGSPDLLAVVQGSLEIPDIAILVGYFAVLIGLGVYTSRKIVSSEEFMVAGRKIPGWAAGLSVMCAYTSSLSYIATPGKSFGSNWNPVLFAYSMIPVALFVTYFIISYYRKIGIISVYEFLERRLGSWGRMYAGISFLLYMVGRIAVILFLTALLFDKFAHILENNTQNIILLILIIGIITIIYTLLGGMEAVIWADVMQAVIMISGIIICCAILTYKITAGPDPAIAAAWAEGKFSFGKWDFTLADQTLANRTIWVMIIFGVTENLRNLMADQNYVQKFATCTTVKEAKKSVWVATIIYAFMTTAFIYIGTALWAFYNKYNPEVINTMKQDEIFPLYIATELFMGFKGLLIAAIIAAAISTIATAFNCSATIWVQDFHKKFINKNMTDKQSIVMLRVLTIVWGILGIGFAILMLRAESILDVWWTMSGIFGGGILGLFLLALLKIKLRLWQGIVAIAASILSICWGMFVRVSFIAELREVKEGAKPWQEALNLWFANMLDKIPYKCDMDKIIVGAMATAVMVIVAVLLGLTNRGMASPEVAYQEKQDALQSN